MLVVGYRGNKKIYLKTNAKNVLEAFVSRFDRWEYLSTQRGL